MKRRDLIKSALAVVGLSSTASCSLFSQPVKVDPILPVEIFELPPPDLQEQEKAKKIRYTEYINENSGKFNIPGPNDVRLNKNFGE